MMINDIGQANDFRTESWYWNDLRNTPEFEECRFQMVEFRPIVNQSLWNLQPRLDSIHEAWEALVRSWPVIRFNGHQLDEDAINKASDIHKQLVQVREDVASVLGSPVVDVPKNQLLGELNFGPGECYCERREDHHYHYVLRHATIIEGSEDSVD
jgi:hypothetical protein